MAENEKPDRWTYVRNRSKWTPDELAVYGDEWVGWSLDGSRIVAHHADLLEATRLAREAGFGGEDVIWEHLPPGGEVDCLL